jgi:hypothetical protein
MNMTFPGLALRTRAMIEEPHFGQNFEPLN